MRTKDRETLRNDAGYRLERMFERFVKFAEGGPTVPWLPRGANLAAVRRTAERLRSGRMRPPHPSIDPLVLAWVLDRAAAQQRVVQESVADADIHRALSASVRSRYERERLMRRRAAFHRLKRSPEARDPESDAAWKARQLHRQRRRELGRPGRRRGNESESPRARRRLIRSPLTFVVGNAQHVFLEPWGTSVAETLDAWFPGQFRHTEEEPWCSAPVEWRGWSDLQRCAVSLLGEEAVPYLLNTDACLGVFLPTEVEACGVTNIIAGDPSTLDVGAVDGLIGELERLASRRVLPIDDAALLEMPERVDDGDFALLTYAQVLRAAHYARRARLPLWAVR
jgi:hypothetical protein